MSVDRGRLYRIESGFVNPDPEEILMWADIGALGIKKAAAQKSKADQEAVIASCKAVLACLQEIEGKGAEYNVNIEKEKL